MNTNEILPWLLLGLLPYRIELRRGGKGQFRLRIQALFWALIVQRGRNRRTNWVLHLILVERLRDAVWAAIMHLKNGK